MIIVDNSQGQRIMAHDKKTSIETLVEILDENKRYLTLVSNALANIDNKHLKCIFLLAPNGAIEQTVQNRLVDFVENGGVVVYAAGYYESIEQNEWLKKFGCEITPLVLGAGQEVQLVDSNFKHVPRIAETWAIDMTTEWKPIVTCFDKPVIAQRHVGAGKVAVISDSFALRDEYMGSDNIDPDSYSFVSALANAIEDRD